MKTSAENLTSKKSDIIKPILAIETSGSLCGVCVYFSDKKYFEVKILLKHSHAEKLFEAIDYVLKSSDKNPDELKCIAVSAGPGSFTGLRIGMAAAKGIAFGAGIPISPVPTFEAMALQLINILNDGTQFIIANKVNVEEIYFAKFQINGNNFIFVENLSIINRDNFDDLCGDLPVFGNVGSDKEKYEYSAPDPHYVAKWTERYGNEKMSYDFDFLEPNYLKNFIIKEKKK